MAMDYTQLIASDSTAGSIANWINHASAQASATSILEEAESLIYRKLRHWRMLAETTGVFSIGNDFITLPTRYLQDKTFFITGTNFQKLTRKLPEVVKLAYQYDGNGVRVNQQPLVFYNNATQFKFDSPSDLAYPYELMFFQQPEALGPSNLTNFLTVYYPRLMRCACMLGAAEFMKDIGQGNYDRTYWETETQIEIDKAQTESDMAVRSMEEGAVLV